MCVGSIEVLAEVWEDETTRVGRLHDGKVVSLAFVPEAEAGNYVIVHMGVPVEVLPEADAEAALALRQGAVR